MKGVSTKGKARNEYRVVRVAVHLRQVLLEPRLHEHLLTAAPTCPAIIGTQLISNRATTPQPGGNDIR
jgi:hypothetical protein